MKKRGLALLACVLLISSCAWRETEEEPAEETYVLYFQERNLENAAGSGVLRKEASTLQKAEEVEPEEPEAEEPERESVELVELVELVVVQLVTVEN